MIRKTVYYCGRVQGVGFRYTARRVARGFAITGYVRNMDDGRVELVAEGELEEVQRFVDEVDYQMRQYIQDAQVSQLPGTGELAGFEIRH